MRKLRVIVVPVLCALVLASVAAGALPASAQTATTASEVSVGSPSGLTPRNHQNEPAVAIDAHDPTCWWQGSTTSSTSSRAR